MSVPGRLAAALAMTLLAIAGQGAARLHAEEVVVDLTSHHIDVKYDFSGASVILFGTVVGQFPKNAVETPDIVIVVEGPARGTRVHRKQQFAGIWFNGASRTFRSAPGYYALVTTRPLSEIAQADKLQTIGIGYPSLIKRFAAEGRSAEAGETRGFADAAVALLKQEGLYREHPQGVRFIGKHLFRAEFSLPANVPVGPYKAEVFLFRGGIFLERYATSLDIEKAGLERAIYGLAHEMPFLYGILSVLAAIGAGLGSSLLFRQK